MADQGGLRRILNTMHNTVQGLAGPSPSSTALQQQESIKSGWLKKQGGIVKSWHSRWFTLKGDQLYYYANQDESKPLGTIFLPGNKVVDVPNNPSEPDKFIFEVVPGGDRSRITMTHETYPICATSEEERKAWVLALKKVMFAFKGGAIFGQSLDETMAYENKVSKRKIPAVVDLCIEFLMKNGLDVEGIFRLPGRSSVVRKLREDFDLGERPKFSLPDVDVHSVASLLKLFLRELPAPLIPVTLYEAVMKLVTRDFHQNPEDSLIALSNVLQKISRHQYNLLQYICFFLSAVSKNSEVNKMNVMNLATVFVQNNIIQPEDNDAVLLMGTANGRTQVAFILITYCDQLFKVDYNEQGSFILVDNLLDIGDNERAFMSDSSGSRDRQSASQLLEIDQTGDLPSPLAPQIAKSEKEPNNPSEECSENISRESSPAEEVSDKEDSLSSSWTEIQTNHFSEETSVDEPVPEAPAADQPTPDADKPEPPEVPKQLRPAPIPRSRSYRERIIPPASEGMVADRRSMTVSDHMRPNRPLRPPPPPPVRPTEPPKASGNADKPDVHKDTRDKDGEVRDDAVDLLLNVNLEVLNREDLLAHVTCLRDELRQQMLQVQNLRSDNAHIREQHKQHVLDLSKRINDEKTATANAVQRIMQLQNELHQYALKHGNLA